MPRSKPARDPTQLSGKPLSETLQKSPLEITSSSEEWVTSSDLEEKNLSFTPDVVTDLNTFLLAHPNLNSSVLFRADILFDSAGVLTTPGDEDADGEHSTETGEGDVQPLPAWTITGFRLTRTVVRKMIPRNPRLDRPLDQTCHFYEAETEPADADSKRILFTWTPHVSSKDELPYYHPKIRALGFMYDFKHELSNERGQGQGQGQMSIHVHLYKDEPITNRLERTLSSLLDTQIRLARNSNTVRQSDGSNRKPNKDNVVSRRQVQDTYTRLKATYAGHLCQRWVEDTEPSKHVFEDLAITAFCVELWRIMYGVAPLAETGNRPREGEYHPDFPGFVDVACGNGVLVYVLLMEGYRGWGFDARKRKSWSIFPEFVQAQLKESVYIPKPFSDSLTGQGGPDLGVQTHTGMFGENTFIISNHADELTVWTPLMAALSNPSLPLPFLAIPCCSHSLSGARYRYPPPRKQKTTESTSSQPDQEQPQTGDLKALQRAKQESQPSEGMHSNDSMYGSLTTKAMTIAEEIGYDIEKTMLRIPSTRNMGVVGGRKTTTERWKGASSRDTRNQDGDTIIEKVDDIVRRECAREGGVEAAAKIWVERAGGLRKGQGKGREPRH